MKTIETTISLDELKEMSENSYNSRKKVNCMIIHHKGLTLEHWFKFSMAEQLANVGCEIERTIRWRDKGNLEYSRLSFERALELLMLTKMDPKHKGRRKELCRSYEALVDHFVYDNEYNTTDECWQNYFYQFNYAAAKQRGR